METRPPSDRVGLDRPCSGLTKSGLGPKNDATLYHSYRFPHPTMPPNRTASFLGGPSRWDRVRIALDDTHPLWGGKRLEVTGDGHARLRVRERDHTTVEYTLTIGPERAQALLSQCVAADPLAASWRPGEHGAEEIATRLELTNADGETAVVTHWANDRTDPHFEAVRALLLELAAEVEHLGSRIQPRLLAAAPPPPPVTDPAQALLAVVKRFLAANGWSFDPHPERPILHIPFQGTHARWTAYAQVRAFDGIAQLLFYSVMPFTVPAEKRLAVAEFITRANYGLILGNFELDFNDGEVRYKTSIEVTGGELADYLIRPLLYTNVLMMDKYLPGILAVVFGDVPPAEAVQQVEAG